MQPLEIKITTIAELAGAKAALTQLERQSGAAKVLGKDFSDTVPKIEAARKAIADFERQYAAASKAAQASQISQPAQSGPIRVPVPGTRNINLQDPESERARIASQLKFNTTRAAKSNQGSGIGQFFSGHNQELVQTIPMLGQVESLIAKMASGPLGFIAAGFAAIAAAIGLAGKAVKEFAETEKEIARVDTALAQIGQLTDANREKIQEFAEAQQNATGIADERWLAIARGILQMSKNVDTLYADADAVKNFAGITGSLEESVMAVGKAIQGEFETFRRYGIYISETGTQAEKLSQLYRELAVRGGGQLEASTKTLAGQYQNLKNQMADTLKGIGQWISETLILQSSLEFVAGGFEWLAEKMGHTSKQVDGLTNSLRKVKPTADEIAKSIKIITFQMDEMDRAQKAVNKSISDFGELIRTAYSGAESTFEAFHNRMASVADVFEKTSIITHQEAMTAKLAIDEHYERARLALHQKAIEDESAQDKDAYTQHLADEKEIKTKLDDVRKRKSNLNKNDKSTADADRDFKLYNNYNTEFENQQKYINEMADTPNPPSKAAMEQMQKDLDEKRNRRDAAKKVYERALARVKELKDIHETLDKEENDLVERLGPVVTRNREEKENIKRADNRRRLAFQYESANTEIGIQQKKDEYRASMMGQPYEDPRNLNPKFDSRTIRNPQQRQEYNQLGKVMEAGLRAEEMVQFGDKKTAAKGEAVLKQIDQHYGSLENVMDRLMGIMNRQGAFNQRTQARLSRIESQMLNDYGN